MADDLLTILKAIYRPLEGRVAHSLMDLMHEFGSVRSALLHSRLFVPILREIDGSILIDLDDSGDELTDRFREGKAEGALPLPELEASFNYVELPYLFSNRDTNNAELLLLAHQVQSAWGAQLRIQFPGRCFTFVLVGTGDDTESDIGIQFFEDRG